MSEAPCLACCYAAPRLPMVTTVHSGRAQRAQAAGTCRLCEFRSLSDGRSRQVARHGRFGSISQMSSQQSMSLAYQCLVRVQAAQVYTSSMDIEDRSRWSPASEGEGQRSYPFWYIFSVTYVVIMLEKRSLTAPFKSRRAFVNFLRAPEGTEGHAVGNSRWSNKDLEPTPVSERTWTWYNL